jgi:hypothetical protein
MCQHRVARTRLRLLSAPILGRELPGHAAEQGCGSLRCPTMSVVADEPSRSCSSSPSRPPPPATAAASDPTTTTTDHVAPTTASLPQVGASHSRRPLQVTFVGDGDGRERPDQASRHPRVDGTSLAPRWPGWCRPHPSGTRSSRPTTRISSCSSSASGRTDGRKASANPGGPSGTATVVDPFSTSSPETGPRSSDRHGCGRRPGDHRRFVALTRCRPAADARDVDYLPGGQYLSGPGGLRRHRRVAHNRGAGAPAPNRQPHSAPTGWWH